MRRSIPAVLALAVILSTPAALSAQSTWIVDAAGGPDVDFTDIQPAVDAAADGDRILIRAGHYNGFELIAKGLAIHGEPGVQLSSTGTLHIKNTRPDQPVTISDLTIRGVSIARAQGTTNCQGRVLFERILAEDLTSIPSFDSSPDVRMRFCEIRRPVSVRSSRLTASDCIFRTGLVYPSTVPALDVDDSSVVLARCAVTASTSGPIGRTAPAIDLDADSTLRLTGLGRRAVTATQGGGLSMPAIDGDGTVLRDPRVPLTSNAGAPPVAATLTDTVVDIPELQVLGGSEAGNRVALRLSGRRGSLWGLTFGLPAPPVELPGLAGSLDYGTPLIALQGTFGSQPVRLSYTAGPGLPPGFQLCWQAIANEPGGTWQFSNSETYARRR